MLEYLFKRNLSCAQFFVMLVWFCACLLLNGWRLGVVAASALLMNVFLDFVSEELE